MRRFFTEQTVNDQMKDNFKNMCHQKPYYVD